MNDIVFNRVWGMPIAIEMTLLSVASFAAVWAAYYWTKGDRTAALIGGLLAVVLPIGSLIIITLDLLKPLSGVLLFPILNPRSNLASWMVWGGIGIGAFIAASGLFTILASPIAASRVKNPKLVARVGGVAAVLGVFIALYPGQLMAYERGIPFWHNAAMPVIALLMGVAGGTAVFALLLRPVGKPLALASLSLVLVYVLHVHLSLIGPRAATVSATAALGHWGTLLGVVLALLATVLALASPRARWLAPVAGIAAIGAVFALRVVLLEVGTWELTMPL